MPSRVLVTGATGFIASRIVEQLLAQGHNVVGTVRSLRNSTTVQPLTHLSHADERLMLIEADLLAPGAFDAAVAGCDVVMHTASPYVLTVNDPQKDLVNPAVEGTLNVLRACTKTSSVRRVVLTSSMAAITDEPSSDHELTEADWNTKSSLTRNPYYYSKTLAERAAWDFMERERPSFSLVVINPFMVVGPSLAPSLNVSNQIFADIVTGKYPGIMQLAWGFTDVRDVADAHVRTMATAAANGRYLCAGEVVTMAALVALLKAHCGAEQWKLPSLPLPNVIVTLASFAQPSGVGTYLRTHVGRVPRYSTAKITRDLGLRFRPATETVLETMADLKRWGHI